MNDGAGDSIRFSGCPEGAPEERARLGMETSRRAVEGLMAAVEDEVGDGFVFNKWRVPWALKERATVEREEGG